MALPEMKFKNKFEDKKKKILMKATEKIAKKKAKYEKKADDSAEESAESPEEEASEDESTEKDGKGGPGYSNGKANTASDGFATDQIRTGLGPHSKSFKKLKNAAGYIAPIDHWGT